MKYYQQSLTDLLTDLLESLYKMHIEKSEEIEILVASLRSRHDIRRQATRLLRIEVDCPEAPRAENPG